MLCPVIIGKCHSNSALGFHCHWPPGGQGRNGYSHTAAGKTETLKEMAYPWPHGCQDTGPELTPRVSQSKLRLFALEPLLGRKSRWESKLPGSHSCCLNHGQWTTKPRGTTQKECAVLGRPFQLDRLCCVFLCFLSPILLPPAQDLQDANLHGLHLPGPLVL